MRWIWWNWPLIIRCYERDFNAKRMYLAPLRIENADGLVYRKSPNTPRYNRCRYDKIARSVQDAAERPDKS